MAQTRILSASKDDLQTASDALARGELVAIPTETVYGLAASSDNDAAIARVFAAKQRPKFDPLITHVSKYFNSCDALERAGLIKEITNPKLRELTDLLIQKFWPGPLTIIFPRGVAVSDIAASGLLTTAIRMPNHSATQELLSLFGGSVVAPSANRFGRISPVTAEDVLAELNGKVSYIVDGGSCSIGLESTIVAINETKLELELFRAGGVSLDALKQFFPKITPALANAEHSPTAPGQLKSHYAPSRPAIMLDQAVSEATIEALVVEVHRCWDASDHEHLAKLKPKEITFLCKNPNAARDDMLTKALKKFSVNVLHLTKNDDSHVAARSLFQCLRSYDNSSSQMLFVEPIEDERDLWPAIRDRLNRATSTRD